MKTNSLDLINKRKTRIEILQDRIKNAEEMINIMKNDLEKREMGETSKIEKALNELREMKQKMTEISTENTNKIDHELTLLKEESLLLVNNTKLRMVDQNKKIIAEKEENESEISKLKQEIIKLKMDLSLSKNKENELMDINGGLLEKINKLESKAYGYDIAKKFEMHQNKKNNEKRYQMSDPNSSKANEDNYLANNFWNRESDSNKQPSKLDDINKKVGLWVGNSSTNIDKLVSDVENINIRYSNNELKTGMRKHTSLIFNNK